MTEQLLTLPVGIIRPDPANPRRNLGDLTDLVSSIRSQGLLQPLLVRPVSAIQYRLLDGHRRLAAAKAAGLVTVPALCRDAPLAVVALATGHKRPLSPMEQAQAMGSLLRDGHSQAGICRLTGYSSGYVSERLALLELTPATQQHVARGLVRPAEALAAVRQVRAAAVPAARSRPARAARPVPAPYFGGQHPLAELAAARCGHRRTARRDGSTVACGECWEATIRADERGLPAAEAS